MNLFDLNPYLRRAWRNSVLSTNVRILPRIIFDYELLYIEQGTLLFAYDGVETCCPEGTVIFIRPGVTHSFVRIFEELHQPHIHFDLTYDTKSTVIPISFKNTDALSPSERKLIREDVFAEFGSSPYLRITNKKRFLELFYGTIEANAVNPVLGKARMLELLTLIIADNFPDFFTPPPETLIEQHIKDFIDAGQGTAFTLDDFEKQFSYDKYYLEKRFRQAYGVSIVAYRNARRMEKAKQLLTHASVSSVADQLGFSSIYSFSRAFKLHFGYAPSQERTQEPETDAKELYEKK